jgi:O-antigen ligase
MRSVAGFAVGPVSTAELSAAARLDVAGAVLLAGWLIWTGVASVLLTGNAARPALYLGGGCAVTLVVARVTAGRWVWVIPGLTVLAAGLIAWRARDEVFGPGPTAEPFGYANANAAFFVQAAIAGLMLGWHARRPLLRAAGVVAAGAFAMAPVLSGSRTGIVLLGLLLPAALAVQRSRDARTAVALCGGFWLVVLAGTIWLGAVFRPGTERTDGGVGLAARTLTETRLTLWHEAVAIARKHPLRGVGAGGFAEFSPTALADADARFAHHEFLQNAAEHGVPGLFLLAAVFAWGFGRLAATGRHATRSVLPAVSLAALGAHASVDYVLHFPAVPLAAAALVGVGMAQRGRRSAGVHAAVSHEHARARA